MELVVINIGGRGAQTGRSFVCNGGGISGTICMKRQVPAARIRKLPVLFVDTLKLCDFVGLILQLRPFAPPPPKGNQDFSESQQNNVFPIADSINLEEHITKTSMYLGYGVSNIHFYRYN